MDRRVIRPAPYRSGRAIGTLNVVLALVAVGAMAALVLEYGFYRPPVDLRLLHLAEGTILALFVLDRIARLVLARRRGQYFRGNWIDFALIGLLVVGLIIGLRLRHRMLALGALYVSLTQAYLLVALLLRAVSLNLRFAGSGVHPGLLLIGSFLFFSLAGSGLLMLPVATPPDAPAPFYVDALFTATSATCVTGLIVRDTGADWSPFGQAVILGLIQLGGLGIMVSGTMLGVLIGRGLSLRGSDAVSQMMGTERIGEFKRTVLFLVGTVFALEAIGAVLLYRMFATAGDAGQPIPTATAAWRGVFHSVSSFCNAGFCLFSDNMAEGVQEGWAHPLREYWQVMGVMAPLIVLGGLGYPVLRDCGRWVRQRVRGLGRRRPVSMIGSQDPVRARFTLHSKITLWTSVLLIVIGAAGVLLLEPRAQPHRREVGYHPWIDLGSGATGDWPSLDTARRFRAALFQSVSARTAGFNTFDMAELSTAGKAWMCGLMVIGGSPASTAGGMKTVTFALLLLSAYCVLRKRSAIEAFGRTIPETIWRKAVTLGLLYVGWVALIALLLTVAMRGWSFIDLLFEACSACGTVGLSTGVTRQLNLAGKCIIIVAMFVGRVGPVTLLIALSSRVKRVSYAYPDESVIVG